MINSESASSTLNYDSDDDLDINRDEEKILLIGINLIITHIMQLYAHI